jgi:vancomycin resistance protein YoaR
MDYTTDHYARPRPRPRERSDARGRIGQILSLRRRALVVSLVIVSVVLVTAAVVDAWSSAGRVHPGVSVGGLQVGGKTPGAAAAALKAALPAETTTPVTVRRGSRTWAVTTHMIGASFDYANLTDQAMSVGRSGGPLGSVGQRIQSWLGGTTLRAPAIADPDKLRATADSIASAIDASPRDAALKVSASGVTLKHAATGLAVDRRALESQILAAFGVGASRQVRVAATTLQPKVADSQAERAQTVAQQMVSGSATVTYKTKTWTLTRAELASMVQVRSVASSGSSGGSGWSLDPVIGAAQASKIIVPKVGAALGNSPVSATFAAHGTSVSIVRSKDGVGPDVADFAAGLTAAINSSGGARSVELRTKITAPKLTTAQARAMGVKQRIATFTTTYSTTLPARVNNIHVLGAALDGKLVAPGDTFSLNDAVGQRTAAKGYQEANAIVKGKLVPQMGGGICQVATTLFNAVFMSGLPITERVSHSFYIALYPMGRDCTVSWDGPDLRWKNSTGHWVLVSVANSADSITVSLYGTNPGYAVSYTTVPFTNNVPFTMSTVASSTLPAGTRQVVSAGENGGKTVVKRVVTKNGAQVRTDVFTSDYVPVEQTIGVGTKKTVVPKPVISAVAPTKPKAAAGH